MNYAWLVFSSEAYEADQNAYDPGLNKMLSGETQVEVVKQANAILSTLGEPRECFGADMWNHYPAQIELGSGVVAQLFACNENGVNFCEPREPVGE